MPNVTLDFDDVEFPCPVCGKLRPIGMTKKDKPYLKCNGCGVQLFVRMEEGIERLRRLVVGRDGRERGALDE